MPAFASSWTLPHVRCNCVLTMHKTSKVMHTGHITSLQPRSHAPKHPPQNTPAAQTAHRLCAICLHCTQEPPSTPLHLKTHQHKHAPPISGGGSQFPASAACSCLCCWWLARPCGHPACLLSWWEPGLQGYLAGWQRLVSLSAAAAGLAAAEGCLAADLTGSEQVAQYHQPAGTHTTSNTREL